MNNQEYWELRRAREMYQHMEDAEKLAAELEVAYRKAAFYLQKEAEKIFNKYQEKYGLTRMEAELLLKNSKVPENIDEIKLLLERDKKNKELLKALETPAYKARIDNLANVFGQLNSIVLPMIADERRKHMALYESLAEEAYYQTVFDLQQYSGYGFNFKALDKKTIQRVLNTKWSAKSFSQSIWDNTHVLAESVKREILVNLLTGRPLHKAQQAIQEKFKSGSDAARRLVRTESAYVCNQLQIEGYKASGVERYIYVAILDLKTSVTCRNLDKEDFLVSEAVVGVNYPPMHPWCRSTTVAHVSKELLAKMKQSAIDPATGKRTLVPGNMTYKEWYKKYVEGKEDVIAQEKAMKNKSYNKDQHERYRNVLGDHVPESFEKFSEIKYNDKEAYEVLKHAYRIANQYEHNGGNMDPMKIVELHDEAVKNKALLTGTARKKGNMGLMELDGELHIASSQINSALDPGYVNFKGDKDIIVVSPEKQSFETLVVGHDRKVDSEYKLFEYASKICDDGKAHRLEMISEKAMCDSCKGVMKQFMDRYPEVEVNVVSHKEEKAKKNHNRNPIFEHDVKKEYELNENH